MKLPAIQSIGIGAAMSVIVGLTIFQRIRRDERSLIPTDIYSFLLLGWSVLVSWPYLGGDGMLVQTDKWKIILGPPLMFALSVLVNAVIGFWIFSIGYSLFNPKRIRQVNLKLFGIEINNSLSAEEQTVATAGNSAVALVERINFVDEINREFVGFYARSLNHKVAVQQRRRPETIRQTVQDLLKKIYLGIKDESFIIHVIPLTSAGISMLDDDLQAILRATDDGEKHQSGVTNNVGLSLHRLEDDRYDTAIVIKPMGEYELSGLEVHTIATFFLSLVTTGVGGEEALGKTGLLDMENWMNK